MVTIHNYETALVAIAMVEGVAWGNCERQQPASTYSLASARKQWEQVQERIQAGEEPPSSFVACIYGGGGVHRYFVNAAGEILFDLFYAYPKHEAQAKAEAAGFRIRG